MSASSEPDLAHETEAVTHVGLVRSGNEDRYLVGRSVLAVADGMGGHAAGEVASQMALEPLAALDGEQFATVEQAEKALVAAVGEANERVVARARADRELRGMGTTLTSALLRRGVLHLAHVGDSRAYLYRESLGLQQLTTDHTLVGELIREGQLTPEQAATHPQRSVITRAIGVEEQVQVELHQPIKLLEGDQLLLCSDGLTGPVEDDEIALLLEESADTRRACQALIDAALREGAPDNVTVVLARALAQARPTASSGAGDETVADDESADVDVTATRKEPASDDAGAEGADEPHAAASDPADGGDRPAESIRSIRTREERAHTFDADRFGRLGQPQGVEGGQGGMFTGRRGRRTVAAVLAIAILASVLVGGGIFVLSRSFFVGTDSGRVAIFTGIPQEPFGISLYRLQEVTDLPLGDFPGFRQERLREGITEPTLADARRRVGALREELDRLDGGPEPAVNDAEQGTP